MARSQRRRQPASVPAPLAQPATETAAVAKPDRAELIASHYRQHDSPQLRYPHTRESELADADTLKRIFAALDKGLSPARAFQRVGLSDRTWRRWQELGETDPESAHGQFVRAVKEAETAWIERQHDGMEAAALEDSRNWPARMTMLERRFPAEYGRRDPQTAVQLNVQVNLPGQATYPPWLTQSTLSDSNG